MDNCDETIRELEAFLDGALSEDGHHTIHDHLEGCSECLQAFDFQAEHGTGHAFFDCDDS